MLNSTQLADIIEEFKAGYQIPPYVRDEVVAQIAKEAHAYMLSLNPMFVVDVDSVGRGLMKCRMFYAYNHREHMFQGDFGADITTWQFDSLEGLNG